jgi:hypothetical protein
MIVHRDDGARCLSEPGPRDRWAHENLQLPLFQALIRKVEFLRAGKINWQHGSKAAADNQEFFPSMRHGFWRVLWRVVARLRRGTGLVSVACRRVDAESNPSEPAGARCVTMQK